MATEAILSLLARQAGQGNNGLGSKYRQMDTKYYEIGKTDTALEVLVSSSRKELHSNLAYFIFSKLCVSLLFVSLLAKHHLSLLMHLT